MTQIALWVMFIQAPARNQDRDEQVGINLKDWGLESLTDGVLDVDA